MSGLSTALSVASAFGGMFGDSPGDAAAPHLAQAKQDIQDYSNIPIDRGYRTSQLLEPLYKQLMEDPQKIMEMLSSGYQSSPGYQFKLQQALQAANQAHAAGGSLGTPANAYDDMNVANGIASQDFNDFYNRKLGLFNTGVSGNQHFSDTGTDMARAVMEDLASLSGAQGAYAAKDTAGSNNAISNIFGGIGSNAGGIANLIKGFGGAGASTSNNSFIPSFK